MERLSTVDLLVLTSLEQLIFILEFGNIMYLFCKASYNNEEVNCTEPSPPVRVPWFVYYFKRNRCLHTFCMTSFQGDQKIYLKFAQYLLM